MNLVLSSSLVGNKLPEELLHLLQSNMNGSLAHYNGFLQYLHSHPYLAALVEKSFRDVDELARPDIIFKSLGWDGIKERLFELFFKKRYGDVTPDIILDALETVSRQYSPFTVDGFSRHLILFFYINTIEREDEIIVSFNEFLINSETLDYLRFFKQRVLKIDIILLSLFVFEKYLGRKVLLTELQNGDYDSIYLKLNQEQKKDYIEVLLHYSFSVDDDLFDEDRV